MDTDVNPQEVPAHLAHEELGRGDLLLARIVDFARLLWELGLDVGPGRVIEVARSLPLINVGRRTEFYTCLKVTLVSKHEQEPLFDAAFAYFWRPPAGSAAYHELPEEERAAFIAEKRREYEEDIDVYEVASDFSIEAVIPSDELRDELIRRYEIYCRKDVPPANRRNGVMPV